MNNLKNSAEDNAKIESVLKEVETALLKQKDEQGEPVNDIERLKELKAIFNKKENASVENYTEVMPVHELTFDSRKTETQRIKRLNEAFGIELTKNDANGQGGGLPVKIQVEKIEEAEAPAKKSKK